MIEQEWLECESPEEMLLHLGGTGRKRKLLLFSCACERRLWNEQDCERDLIVALERYADGKVPPEDVHAVLQDIRQSEHFTPEDITGMDTLEWAIGESYNSAEYAANLATQRTTGKPRSHRNEHVWRKALLAEQAAQADLLRDIFSNPFRPVALDPAWRTTAVVQLAQGSYDERQLPGGQLDLTRIAILADALDEAGCTNADILSHCRGPGPHVRGCFLVDLCLGLS